MIEESEFDEHSCVLLPCEICGKEFANQSYLEHHIKYSHAQKRDYLACDTCGKLVLKQSMKSHVQLHITSQMIPCPVCGIKLRSQTVLKKHLKIHDKEKTLCQICNKEVKNLKMHVFNWHTSDKDKKYKCDDCGKGFAYESTLRSHKMSVHIKSRPYKCRYGCAFAYNDNSNRNAHEEESREGI